MKKILREMIPVMLGVLLALLIDNWNKSIQDKSFLAEIITSIKEELRENHNSIMEIKIGQSAMIDTVDFYMLNDSTSILEIITKANGFKSPSIKNTSWKALINSKIELTDYETISILSEVEEEKIILNTKLDKMMDFIYQNLNKKGQQEKTILKTFLVDIMHSENSLLKLCDEFLKD